VSAAYARLLEALTNNGYKYKDDGRGRARAQCPAHGKGGSDQDLNLAVAVGDQGVLLRCHSHDCPAEDIAKGVGLTLNDLFDRDGRALYRYPGGHEVIRTRTRDGKKIIQHNHPGSVTQLYRHPKSKPIESSHEVVLVEGEKSVDAALMLGFECVTTWPGGASNVDKVDVTPLSGKTVHLIADNDEPGRAAMAHMATMLQGIATVATITTAPKEKQGIDDIWLDGGEVTDLIPFDPSNYVKGPAEEDDRRGVLKTLSNYRSRKMRWLWDDIIPAGAAVIFAGMGGVSKSTFSIWLAGRVTRGLVKGYLLDQPSHVLYVSHEDGIEEVVLPRAQANGVDTEKFHIFGIESKQVNGVMMPKFPEDLRALEEKIKEVDAKVVIVDPILSAMASGRDPNSNVDVRELIDPLNQLAQRLGITVICIAHINKSASNARTAVTGSAAWVDATRGTLMFAMDVPDPQQDYTDVVIGATKGNYSKNGMAYTYRVSSVEHLHDSGEFGSIPKIQWLGISTRSVEDVMAAHSEDRREGFLKGQIKEYVDSFNGAVSTRDILQEFRDQNAATVRMTLSRMVKSGQIDSPERGYYQSAKLRQAG
jgi:archaellum biogenesis ATPase FlaH